MMIIILLICLCYANGLPVLSDEARDADTTSNNFITQCLNPNGPNVKCEDTVYQILPFFYTCELLGSFDAPPKRISYKDDSVFVAISSRTFSITNSSEDPIEVNTVIPPTGAVIDKYKNRFYVGDGTTYVMLENSGKEIEIVTSEDYTLNELALDDEINQLFIMSFSVDRHRKNSGSLYVLNTETLVPDVNGKIKAKKIDDFGERFSALTISKTSGAIILGVADENGGKLLKLNRKKNDPCSQKFEKRTQFHKTLMEVTEQLMKIFDDAMKDNSGQNLRTQVNDVSEMKKLTMEKTLLEKKLHIATTKLDGFTKKIFAFSGSLKKIQAQQEQFTKVSNPVKDKNNDLECLPIREIKALRAENEELAGRVDLFESIFSGTITVLDGMVEEPVVSAVTEKDESLPINIPAQTTEQNENTEAQDKFAGLQSYFV